MKVSRRVEKIIDVELDSEAAAQLRWVFERSNNGLYHESLAPLAQALGVGETHDDDYFLADPSGGGVWVGETHETRPIIPMTGVSVDE